MTTLFLAWQDTRRSHGWYPIGRLDADITRPLYRFHYIRGAERAHQEAGLQPLVSFPDFHEQYELEMDVEIIVRPRPPQKRTRRRGQVRVIEAAV